MNKQMTIEKAEQKQPVKWIVPLPQKEKGTFGRPSLCAACRGNEDIGVILNYFLYEASVEAERLKIDTSKVQSITLERTLDEILEGIKPSRTSKKTLIGYHKKLKDWEFVIPHGYKHRYDVYFHNIADAMATPPQAEKRRPRGRHVSKRQSSEVKTTIPTIHDVKTTISEDGSDERWLKLQSEMVALQSEIVKLQSEIVTLQSQMVALQSGQSSERASQQGLMPVLEVPRLIDCNRLLETKESNGVAFANATPTPFVSQDIPDLDDEIFVMCVEDWLKHRDISPVEQTVTTNNGVVKELTRQLQAMHITMQYPLDEHALFAPNAPDPVGGASPFAEATTVGASAPSSSIQQADSLSTASKRLIHTDVENGAQENVLRSDSESGPSETPLSASKPSVGQRNATTAAIQREDIPASSAHNAMTNSHQASEQTNSYSRDAAQPAIDGEETQDTVQPNGKGKGKSAGKKSDEEKTSKPAKPTKAQIDHVFKVITDTLRPLYVRDLPKFDPETFVVLQSIKATNAVKQLIQATAYPPLLKLVIEDMWNEADARGSHWWRKPGRMTIPAIVEQYTARAPGLAYKLPRKGEISKPSLPDRIDPMSTRPETYRFVPSGPLPQNLPDVFDDELIVPPPPSRKKTVAERVEQSLADARTRMLGGAA